MSSRRLILHIGPHKTGTTAIQATLNASKPQLKELDWHYETFPELQGGAHQLADLLSFERFAETEGSLLKISDSGSNVVISSENLSRLGPAAIRFLKDKLSGFHTDVYFMLRSPLGRLPSLWKENIKHGYEYCFSDFIVTRILRAITDDQVNDHIKLTRWSAEFGIDALNLLVYEPGDEIVSRFFRHALSADVVDFAQIPTTNKSFDEVRTEAMRVLFGLQLLTSRSADARAGFLEIEQTLRSRLTDSDFLKFSATMNHVAFRTIEMNLVRDFGQRITGSASATHVFRERDFRWRAVNPNVWLRNPDLLNKVEAYRTALLREFGKPRLDSRLRAI